MTTATDVQRETVERLLEKGWFVSGSYCRSIFLVRLWPFHLPDGRVLRIQNWTRPSIRVLPGGKVRLCRKTKGSPKRTRRAQCRTLLG